MANSLKCQRRFHSKILRFQRFRSRLNIFFLGIFGVASLILQIDVIYLITGERHFVLVTTYPDLPTCDDIIGFHDIMKIIFCILYLHYFIRYDKNNVRGWKDYNLLEKIIIVIPYIAVFLTVFAVAYIGVVRIAYNWIERIIFGVTSLGSYLVYLGACMTDWYDWLDEVDGFDGKKFSTNNTYTSTVVCGLQEEYESLIVTDLSTRWSPKKKKRTALYSECPIPTFKISSSAMKNLLETAYANVK